VTAFSAERCTKQAQIADHLPSGESACSQPPVTSVSAERCTKQARKRHRRKFSGRSSEENQREEKKYQQSAFKKDVLEAHDCGDGVWYEKLGRP